MAAVVAAAVGVRLGVLARLEAKVGAVGGR